MADNDRYVIIEESEFNRIVNVYLKSIGCKYYLAKVKTRAEYEDMIAESIYNAMVLNYKNSLMKNEVFKKCKFVVPDFVGDGFKKIAKYDAKAVVDRLFGEGE